MWNFYVECILSIADDGCLLCMGCLWCILLLHSKLPLGDNKDSLNIEPWLVKNKYEAKESETPYLPRF